MWGLVAAEEVRGDSRPTSVPPESVLLGWTVGISVGKVWVGMEGPTPSEWAVWPEVMYKSRWGLS